MRMRFPKQHRASCQKFSWDCSPDMFKQIIHDVTAAIHTELEEVLSNFWTTKWILWFWHINLSLHFISLHLFNSFQQSDPKHIARPDSGEKMDTFTCQKCHVLGLVVLGGGGSVILATIPLLCAHGEQKNTKLKSKKV